jgi:hypothetical protein
MKAVYDILTKDGYNVTIAQPPETSLDDDIAATNRVLDAQDGPPCSSATAMAASLSLARATIPT